MKTSVLVSILCSIIILLTAVSYKDALHGPFVFDDQVNIQENPGVFLNDLSAASLEKAMLSNESGELKRILPALSFGINYYQAQGFQNTFVFKVTNLIIHLLNSLLVFWLIYQLSPRLFRSFENGLLTSSRQNLLLAFFVALLWALHPLQVSTVAYIVQRMTSMASLFMLLGLNLYVYARNRVELGSKLGLAGMVLAVLVGTALGLLSKENAALTILYAAAIEFCLYPKQGIGKKILLSYGVLFGIGTLLVLYIVLSGRYDPLAGYYARPFTLEQRLLTEVRVLWLYVQMLVVPDIRVMNLYHDDLAISQNWFEPVTSIISVVMWAVILLVAWLVRNKLPTLTFAIVWFLVGHSMESTILPLEIIFEHRNYLPSLSICILIVFGLSYLGTALKSHQTELLTGALLTACVLVYFGLTMVRAGYWQSEESLFKSMAENHPLSPISLYTYAELLNKKKHQPAQAYQYYLKAVELNKNSASLMMQAKLSAPINGQVDPLLDNQKLYNQLNRNRLVPWDISVLNDAAHCVLTRSLNCAEHLQEVRQWLNASIDNSYLNQEWRRDFIKSLFDMEMMYGLPEEALKTVTKAQAQDDRVFHYYLMKADALNAVGRKEESLALINTAEQLAQRYNPQLLQGVYRLRNKVVQQP